MLKPSDIARLSLTERDPSSQPSRPFVRWCGDLVEWVSGLWATDWAALPVYADNAAAVAAHLAVGKPYQTATGEVRVVV